MISLYVGSKKGFIYDTDGVPFKVLPVYYKKNGEMLELRLSTSLPPLDDAQIFFQWWKYFIPLPIPQRLKDSILDFLAENHLVCDCSFDCYSFACTYADVPLHGKEDLKDYWSLTTFRFRPRVGDVIFLLSDQENGYTQFHHAAIYLGFGKYLSVLGGGGQFEVATLQDMKRDFHAKSIYIAIPN